MPQSWAEPTRPRDPVEPTSEASVPTPGLAQRRQRKEREREAGREGKESREGITIFLNSEIMTSMFIEVSTRLNSIYSSNIKILEKL